MPHPLVTQLRFARAEFTRCLEGITPEEAHQRLEPMNSLSWIVGHLASQEHVLWIMMGQGEVLAPDLYKKVGTGKPASIPDWDAMRRVWGEITRAADRYLDTIDNGLLDERLEWRGKVRSETIGTSLLRNTYHYWFHLGEAHAIRQMLGHTDLPDFVGSMEGIRY